MTCDAQGAVRRHSIFGSPKDRQGRDLHFGAKPEREPPADGLELDTLVVTWDGTDTLTLQADFFWRKGPSAISSTDDPATQPVPIRMQRQRSGAAEPTCAASLFATPTAASLAPHESAVGIVESVRSAGQARQYAYRLTIVEI